MSRIGKSIETESSCQELKGRRGGDLFLMIVGFFGDDENVLKLCSGNNSMNILKTTELYTLKGVIFVSFLFYIGV